MVEEIDERVKTLITASVRRGFATALLKLFEVTGDGILVQQVMFGSGYAPEHFQPPVMEDAAFETLKSAVGGAAKQREILEAGGHRVSQDNSAPKGDEKT